MRRRRRRRRKTLLFVIFIPDPSHSVLLISDMYSVFTFLTSLLYCCLSDFVNTVNKKKKKYVKEEQGGGEKNKEEGA
jgi:hypothetical protein